MTRDWPLCRSCEKEPCRDNALLCHPCTRRLERDLGDVPALLAEVETTHLGQSRTGGAQIGTASRSAETVLPWDDRPVDAARALRKVLVTWGVRVVEARGGRVPSGDPARLSSYLLGSVDWLRHQDDAPAAKQDLEGAISRVRYSIDRAAPRVYLGPCGSIEHTESGHMILCTPLCPAELYARPKQTHAVCSECQAEHDVKDRREWLLEAVDDQLDYPANLARALSSLGMPVPAATIRSWVDRKRLVAHGVDQRGRALYRVGDVRQLVTDEAVRQAERQVRAEHKADQAEKREQAAAAVKELQERRRTA